jgi:hypothetical protein
MGSHMFLAAVEVPRYEPECFALLSQVHPRSDGPGETAESRSDTDLMKLLRTVMHVRVREWESELEDHEVQDLGEEFLDWYSTDGSVLDEDMEGLRTILRNRVMQALQTTFLQRNTETVEIDLNGKLYAFTGGLSSGDTPTDSYLPMQLLERSEITRKEVTLSEAEAAWAQMKAEKAKERA